MSDLAYQLWVTDNNGLHCIVTGPQETVIKEIRKALYCYTKRFIFNWDHFSLKEALNTGTEIDKNNYSILLFVNNGNDNLHTFFHWLKMITEQPLQEIASDENTDGLSIIGRDQKLSSWRVRSVENGLLKEEEYVDFQSYLNALIRLVNREENFSYELFKNVGPKTWHPLYTDEELESHVRQRRASIRRLEAEYRYRTCFFEDPCLASNAIISRIQLRIDLLKEKIEELVFLFTGTEGLEYYSRIERAIRTGREFIAEDDPRLTSNDTYPYDILFDETKFPKDHSCYCILTNRRITVKKENGESVRFKAVFDCFAKPDMNTAINYTQQLMLLENKLHSLTHTHPEPPPLPFCPGM